MREARTIHKTRLFVLIAVLVALSVPENPRAVGQAAPNGFVVRHQATVSAPPTKVFDVLVRQVGLWWNPEHTFSGDAKNLSIDPRPGGCFCEKLGKGGGIEHLRVIYIVPGEILRMSGALGPLQASGVNGSLTWTLASAQGGTALDLSYSVGGFLEGGLEKIAPAVDMVLGEQLRRLKRFIETGKAV
jgi:uncharacterized protein YndB with AHSA1/START domain